MIPKTFLIRLTGLLITSATLIARVTMLSQPLPVGTYTIRGPFYSFPDADATTTAEDMIVIVDE